jgi:transcriptional regulator with XRE-family HTH domain
MNSSVGDKIRTLRLNAGLSQAELADKLYFSNRTISSWENNLREVSLENLKKIANFFNISLDYFSDVPLVNVSMNSKQSFQEIKLKPVSIDDRYFYILLMSIFVNIFLYLYPFENLLNASLIFTLYWVAFLIQSITRYTMIHFTKTKKFLIPVGVKVYFSTITNNQQRLSHLIKNSVSYSLLIVLSILFYIGVLSMIQGVDNDTTLIAVMMIFVIFVNFYHIFIILKTITTGLPPPIELYAKDKVDIGMNYHRIAVSAHYFMIIFLMLLTGSYGFSRFSTQFLLLMLFIGAMKFILLRLVFLSNAKFYASYQLMTKDSQSETLQKLI